MLMIVLGVSMGVYCVFCSLCAVDLAKRLLVPANGPSTWPMPPPLCTSYIHPWAVVPLTGLCVAFLRSQGDDITFPDTLTNTSGVIKYQGSNQSTSCISHLEWLWAGLVLVFGGSILTCYPLAGFVRTLPGFKKIL